MAETYTTRLRAVQPEYSSYPETWGTELNIGGLEILDDGWGTTEVPISGNVTLTVANKIADQARGFTLILTGAGGFTVTTPAVDKPYFVINNCAADVSIKPIGGTPATVRAGTGVFYYTNAAASAGYVVDLPLDKIKAAENNLDMNAKRIVNLAQGAASSDHAATVAQVAAMISSAGSLAGFPDILGQALKTLRVNAAGSALEWFYSGLRWQTAATNTACVAGNIYSTSGGVTLTFPASPAAGDRIGVSTESSAETSYVTINLNGQSFDSSTADITIRSGITLIFEYYNSAWRLAA